MTDESLSWKYHISYTCSRISSNVGVISKLRHYLSISQLKQLYYNLANLPLFIICYNSLGICLQNAPEKAAIQTKYSPKINVFRYYVWTLHSRKVLSLS